jgi:cyclophilin family peptidyl-prolyl cis-trans isomerase
LAAEVPKPKPATMAELIRTSKPADWRTLDPQNALYLELSSGRVVIELAPAFAPAHIANIKALIREHYYDGLGIIRVQDNYVAQLGDFDADKPESARKIQNAKRTLSGEFDRPIDPSLSVTKLPDGDVYAPEVGFAQGFPVARDPKANKMWLVHCYGMVGVGRDIAADSGGGTELYFVIGQAPRHLDRNVTLVGRVWAGIELLSALPRGEGALGFYPKRQQCFPIKSVRLAADVPPDERAAIEVLRTDTALFQDLVEARRNRREEWFHYQAGRIDVCNMPVPVRTSETK